MELVISNAERRALAHGESLAVPRVGDIYTSLPGITGKIEFEYEGEMRGADTVVRDIINKAVQRTFDGYFAEVNTQQIEQWFNLGGTVQLSDAVPAEQSLTELQQIQGLFDKLKPLNLEKRASPEALGLRGRVSAGRHDRAQAHLSQRRADLHRGREADPQGSRTELRRRRPRTRDPGLAEPQPHQARFQLSNDKAAVAAAWKVDSKSSSSPPRMPNPHARSASRTARSA